MGKEIGCSYKYNRSKISTPVDIICIWDVWRVFIEVLSLCWIWYDIIVGVKLLADDVWFAEDDNTGFLSVGEDIFHR